MHVMEYTQIVHSAMKYSTAVNNASGQYAAH